MSGQLVDSSLVAAPRQRNTRDEKQAIKAGKSAHEIWPDQPAKARQKDVDARWTIQTGKARPDPERRALLDIAIPTFGYKAHTSIVRRYRLIRCWDVTDAKASNGCPVADNHASSLSRSGSYECRIAFKAFTPAPWRVRSTNSFV